MALEPGTRIGRLQISGPLGAGAIAALILLAVALVWSGGCRWFSSGGMVLASGEPLMLADFANTTDEGVLDGALKDALEIELRQSPYLNVLPAVHVRNALREMGKGPEERVTATLARDICQRLGAKAILLGSIAPRGSAYVIGLDAQACESGGAVVHEQAHAASKTAVLAAVSAAAARMRERLGEPPASIQRFNVSPQNATTESLDALKAYSMALEARANSGDAEAIPLFQHALELDPDFALAAARLGAIYSNLHDVQQAQFYMKRAISASETLTEPERLSIKASYNSIVTGRLEEVIGAYELWAQTYPQDWVPHNDLSAAYLRAGRMEDAFREARAAVTLAPREVVACEQLARTLVAMNRAAEAKEVVREAEENGLDSTFNRVLMYRLAFHEGDTAAMDRHMQAAGTRADGYVIVAEAARAAAASGELEKSRALFRQAIDAATAVDRTDYAGSLMAEQGIDAALLGDPETGRRDMFAAVDISNGPDTLWMASLAASLSGLTDEAIQLAVGYAQAMPPAPDVVATLRPILEAGVALSQKDPNMAIEALNRADQFARASDPWVPFLRGLAHVARKEPSQAIVQFRASVAGLEHQPVTLLHPLAYLHVARLLRAQKDDDGAREAYGRVAAAWKNGDASHPTVAAARREAASMGLR